MARYLLVNDIHLADRPPSSCTDSYLDDLLDLLDQTVVLARDAGVRAVIWAGDVFHHKAPSRTSHKLVQEVIDRVRSYPCPLLIVPGNHDMQNDRLESLVTTQPLGVLLRSGAIPLQYWWWEKGVGVSDVYGVPWLPGYGSYTEESDARVAQALVGWREPAYPLQPALVVTHAPLYPPGRELTYEYFPAARWAEAMGNTGFCWYGHVHEPHGIWECDGVTFANFGALSRGSLHEYNLTRDVCAGMWDSGTGEFEKLTLKARPASEVFRLAEAQESVSARDRLDEFIDGIDSATLESLSVEAVLQHIRDKYPAELVRLAEELLEDQ